MTIALIVEWAGGDSLVQEVGRLLRGLAVTFLSMHTSWIASVVCTPWPSG